jgi:hypothetical protein
VLREYWKTLKAYDDLVMKKLEKHKFYDAYQGVQRYQDLYIAAAQSVVNLLKDIEFTGDLSKYKYLSNDFELSADQTDLMLDYLEQLSKGSIDTREKYNLLGSLNLVYTQHQDLSDSLTKLRNDMMRSEVNA